MARINQRSIDGKMLDSLEQQDRLLILNQYYSLCHIRSVWFIRSLIKEEEKCMMENKLVETGSNEVLSDVLKYPRVLFRFFVMLLMQ